MDMAICIFYTGDVRPIFVSKITKLLLQALQLKQHRKLQMAELQAQPILQDQVYRLHSDKEL